MGLKGRDDGILGLCLFLRSVPTVPRGDDGDISRLTLLGVMAASPGVATLDESGCLADDRSDMAATRPVRSREHRVRFPEEGLFAGGVT